MEVESQQNVGPREYGQIVRDVAHDLNNLLLLISGYSELLTKNLNDHDQALTMVKNIQIATSKLRDLSRTLQTTAQIENVATERESAPDGVSSDPKIVRPRDANIIVFIFDGELKQLVFRTLERQGFGVDEVVVNKSGISTNRDSTESVDLIVADVDIFKVARERVRHLLRKYPGVPLLLLSDPGDEIPTIAAAGGSSSLSKEFRPSELVTEIDRIFASRNSRIANSSEDH